MKEMVRIAWMQRPMMRPGIGMQTARQVDRQHGRAGRVDLINDRADTFVERSVESGAKQRIGDDIVTLEQSEIERLDRHRAGTAFLPCASRITAQALGRNDARDSDLKAGMLGERCQNVAVAAVVSAAAQDQDPLRLWPTCAQRAQRRLTVRASST